MLVEFLLLALHPTRLRIDDGRAERWLSSQTGAAVRGKGGEREEDGDDATDSRTIKIAINVASVREVSFLHKQRGAIMYRVGDDG